VFFIVFFIFILFIPLTLHQVSISTNQCI
jgi:hypothetical protein